MTMTNEVQSKPPLDAMIELWRGIERLHHNDCKIKMIGDPDWQQDAILRTRARDIAYALSLYKDALEKY